MSLARRAQELSAAGRINESTPLLVEALELFDRLGNTAGSADVNALLATDQMLLRRPEEARRYQLRAAELRQERGEILRWALDTALAEGMTAHLGRTDRILERYVELRQTLDGLRRAGGSVRVTGLAPHASVFPPDLARILLRGQPELLPLDGAGGAVLAVVEAALVDMELGFRLELGRSAEARELIQLLEAKARQGAGNYFRILAAFAACQLEHREARRRQAVERCEAALQMLEGYELPAGVPRSTIETLEHQISLQLVELHEELGDFEIVALWDSRARQASPAQDPCGGAKLAMRRAVTRLREGELEAADELLEAARQTLARLGGCGGFDAQAVALLARAEVMLGDLGSAQGHAEEAIRLAARLGDPRIEALAWATRLDVDLFFGDRQRARHALERVEALAPGSELASEARFNFETLTKLRETGFGGAPEVLRESLRTHPGLASDEPRPALQQLGFELFELLAEASSWRQLEAGLERLLEQEVPSPLAESQVLALLGVAAFAQGRISEAADRLVEALELYEEGGLDPGLLFSTLGSVALAGGARQQALPHLQRARTLLERTFATLRSDRSRLRFLDSGHQGVYGMLAEVLIDTGSPEEVFEVSEAARQRALLEALRTPRPGAEDPAPTPERLVEGTGGAAEGTETERQDLLVERARREEASARPDRQAPVEVASLDEVRAAMPPSWSLVSYFTTETRLFAWVVRSESVFFRELSTAGLSLADLRCHNPWSASGDEAERGAQLVAGDDSEDPGPCDPRASGERLYRTLLEPVRDRLGPGPLLLVPHGWLRSIPFAALRAPGSGRYLVEDFALGYLPSVSAVAALRGRGSSAASGSLVVGDPDTESLDGLSYARSEARAIAGLLRTEPILGAHATESRIRGELASGAFDHLYFGTHSAFDRGEADFSRIFLAAGDPHHDGVLEAHEIAHELRLPGVELVALAGCETGLGRRTAGDESLGLVRAFLVAGSRRVLATRWRISDRETRPLMVRFYSELLAGETPLESLRRAQLQLLRAERTADPYYWAAFLLVGDPAPWTLRP
ncbi:MAG: CHAT domain-containing protein [Holophagales bacterium]|nr:CHAT domain-containing protein [Holophagales bacterium]